jgi:single-strand DNA-binding protein
MKYGIATAQVAGNITRDPELRHTTGGTAVANFTVAVGTKYKDNERTSFIDVKLWGVAGETFAKYATKGSAVVVSGKLEQESWEKDGQKRSKIVLNATDFVFAGGKPDTAPTPREPEPTYRATADDAATQRIATAAAESAEEIPF